MKPNAGPNHGISLTEILLVIVLVAALMAIGLLLFRQRVEARNRKATAERLRALEATIAELAASAPDGRVPTSDPEDFLGPDGKPVAGHCDAENPLNHGIECLVLAIRHRGSSFRHSLPPEAFQDLDGDLTFVEIVDGHGNPFVYLDGTSYEEDAKGVKMRMADGRVVVVLPLRDPLTGKFLYPNGHQLISAGSDGKFGTEDDVSN